MKDKIEKAKCYIKTLPLFLSCPQLVDDKPIQDNFIAGYDFAEKELEQKITNLYNKYNSQHQQLTQFKLDKTVNQDARIKMEAKIQVLGELKNKLEK